MGSFLWNRGTYSMAINSCNQNVRFVRIAGAAVLLMACVTAGALPRGKKTAKSAQPASPAETLPVTTSSQAAARYFENGMVHYENHRWNLALNDWHEAVRLDPKFALAYTWICMTTVDPAEESSNRARAKASAKDVTPAERLVVRWMVGIHENRYVEGISAMNDVLAMYPRDKRLNFLFGYWLFRSDQYDLSEKLTQRALAEDPNYATCYNQMGYIHSRRGEYDKALEATAKYVKLLPDEPNPHDSYAEMLRLSGRYDDALKHYHIALKIDPTFYISQKELGETYAIMGDGEKARAEYAKAVDEAPSDGLKAEYLQKAAMTYVRDQQYEAANKAFLEAGEKAHAMKQWIWEARAYRIMAMYEPDKTAATRDLQQAETILAARRDVVSQTDLDEEAARILRVRVERAVAAEDLSAAQTAVTRLEEMANGGTVALERTWHGAAGTLLVAQQKYTDAITQLEEDFANPMSMKLLVTAYEKSGDKQQAKSLRKKLNDWRIPSIEEALIVPAFRSHNTEVLSKN